MLSYTCTTWNPYRQDHSMLHSLNLIFIKLVENDLWGLHFHNLKSLLKISLYTMFAQRDLHCNRATRFLDSTLAQPEDFNSLCGKVAYSTLYSHTLIFITLAKHDFSGLWLLLCIFRTNTYFVLIFMPKLSCCRRLS